MAVVLAVVLVTGLVLWRSRQAPAPGLRIDQVRSFGTHNSYHLAPTDRERRVARLFSGTADQLDYGFPPLADQLRQGLRVFELDLYPDPRGGLYADPLIRRVSGQGRLPGLDGPGTKVLHIADADYRTTCATLVACLAPLRDFTAERPDHAPVFVLLEFKSTDARLQQVGGVTAPPWDGAALDTVDREIRDTLGEQALLTPDDVREPGRSLEQSVLAGGWPTVAAAAGRTVFAMVNEPGPVRDAYLAGHADLAGRVVFTNAPPGSADAAIVKVDDPSGPGRDRIAELVRRGYLVRTRADDGAADAGRLAAARASGAQLVSTDHPEVVPAGAEGEPVACDHAVATGCDPVAAARVGPTAAAD